MGRSVTRTLGENMGSETRARLAFAALLVAALVAFSQLFAGGDYFGPSLLAILLATALAAGARKLGVGLVPTVLASGVALCWYLALVFESRHLLYGLPTPGALGRLPVAVARAYEASRVDFAPVPARPGYVIMLVASTWAAATLGEIATFRWRRPLLASLPPIALVSLVLVVGTGNGASLWVALFLIALLSFWGLESSHRVRGWGRWVSPWAHHSEEPESLTGAVARRMGATCVAAAIVAPLVLPTLDQGLLAWRTDTGAGRGLGDAGRVDLLVSLAPRLLEQTDVRLFNVEAAEPTYWRLTSLAEFDGRDWKPSDADHGELQNGDVDTLEPPISKYRELDQRFTITGLRDDLLPAAVEPESISVEGGPEAVLVDPDTGELLVEGGLPHSTSYRVRSHVPDVASYRSLKRADVGDPGPAFKDVPSDLSDEVFALLERWTDGAKTPFDKLVAIQEHFRRDFGYTTDVRAEDSTDYLTQFLTQTREGYCQQFATAFAILARAEGLPTRVSVGFLPGSPSADNPDVFVVTGNQAHAWPEVYFEEFGWVPFEPTPRAEATEPSYTVPAASALTQNPAAVRNGVGPAAGSLGNRFRDADAGGVSGRTRTEVPFSSGRRAARDPAWAKTFNRLALALVALSGIALLAIPLVKEWRMRALYRRSDGPMGRAVAAFAHFQGEAAELVAPRRASESAVAYARRIASANRAPRRAAVSLAGIYEAAEYGPIGVSATEATEAARLARQLRGALWASASWWQRAERLFSPRGLIRSRTRPTIS
jgi:transglutaminase-like putative cysteine protease